MTPTQRFIGDDSDNEAQLKHGEGWKDKPRVNSKWNEDVLDRLTTVSGIAFFLCFLATVVISIIEIVNTQPDFKRRSTMLIFACLTAGTFPWFVYFCRENKEFAALWSKKEIGVYLFFLCLVYLVLFSFRELGMFSDVLYDCYQRGTVDVYPKGTRVVAV